MLFLTRHWEVELITGVQGIRKGPTRKIQLTGQWATERACWFRGLNPCHGHWGLMGRFLIMERHVIKSGLGSLIWSLLVDWTRRGVIKGKVINCFEGPSQGDSSRKRKQGAAAEVLLRQCPHRGQGKGTLRERGQGWLRGSSLENHENGRITGRRWQLLIKLNVFLRCWISMSMSLKVRGRCQGWTQRFGIP